MNYKLFTIFAETIMNMKTKEMKLPENRGAKRKYDFSDMKVGEVKSFQRINGKPTTNILINCAKSWALRKGKKWSFQSASDIDTGQVLIKRTA